MLPYIDDETYRRRILTQLNRGEGRHTLARVTFHGQRGEVRQRYREGEEDQLGALGLVVNALVFWNTNYLDAAVKQLPDQGMEVKSLNFSKGFLLWDTSISICWGVISLLSSEHFETG